MVTDGQLVKLCRRLQLLQSEMQCLIETIKDSDHENAEELADDLYTQCFGFSWPEHVVKQYLLNPDQWETGNFGIRHIAATKAVENREG